jgi:hypothetical protein
VGGRGPRYLIAAAIGCGVAGAGRYGVPWSRRSLVRYGSGLLPEGWTGGRKPSRSRTKRAETTRKPGQTGALRLLCAYSVAGGELRPRSPVGEKALAAVARKRSCPGPFEASGAQIVSLKTRPSPRYRNPGSARRQASAA